MSHANSATVAEAILRHGAAYRACGPLPPGAGRLMAVLPLCRTAALGGHLHRCTHCGHEEPRYNSCGNRHCPNCQTYAREKWLVKQEACLLDLPYFHMVFTLPAELQPLLLQNKCAGYDLLFKSVAQTLLSFGRDPRQGLEAQLGFTAVLHTWDQSLRPHAHLHVLIPSGGLSKDGTVFRRREGGCWIFPVRALSQVYRAVFLKGLRRLRRDEKLTYHGQLSQLAEDAAFKELLDTVFSKDWVVFAKRPFGGPEAVLRYLGRYTHRVAISNQRIQSVDEHGVRFLARDRKDPSRKRSMQWRGPRKLESLRC